MPTRYLKIHRVLAEGNFVLVGCEAYRQSEKEGGDEKERDNNEMIHTAIYDLYRVENSKIVEHWDAIQEVPEETQNGNTMY